MSSIKRKAFALFQKVLNVFVIMLMVFQPVSVPATYVLAQEAPDLEEISSNEETAVEEESSEEESAQTEEESEPIEEPATETVENPIESLGEGIGETVQQIQETVNEVVQNVGDTQTIQNDQPAEVAETIPEVSTEENADIWSVNGDKAVTNENVKLGEKYTAPQNEEVSVTFTKLPEDSGTLSIEEIALTDEQVEMLGAVSNKAYDITSSMENGTFEYDLTLPKPKNSKEVIVKYAEKISELEDAKVVENKDIEINKNNVEINLDHFTIFLIGTYAEITLTTSKSVYNRTETVYAKADISNSGNFYKLDIKRPNGTTASTSGCQSSSTSIEDNFTLSGAATISTSWAVLVREYATNTNCTNQVSWLNESSINFEVAKRIPTIVLTSDLNPSTYGDQVTFTATVSGTGPTPTGTVDFKKDGVLIQTSANLNGSGVATRTTFPRGLVAGARTITAEYSGDGDYLTGTDSLLQNVNQKTLTISGITGINKVYDGTTSATIDASGASLSGVVSGDTIGVDISTASANFSDKNVDTGKTITITGLALTGTNSDSYALIEPITTIADITAKDLSVSAEAKTKVYGNSDPALTYSSDPLEAGDSFSGFLVRLPGESIGDYQITQGTLSAGTNYNILYTPENLSITKATLTVTPDDQSIEFGSPDPSFTFSYSGFKNGDNSSVIDAEPTCNVASPHTAVGSYDIECSGGSDDTYDFTYNIGEFSVVDTQAPQGGSISYSPTGYTTATQVDIAYSIGTDDASGLNLSSGRIQHRIGTTNGGVCENWGAWENLIHETDGSYSDDTIQNGKCYRYRYAIRDNSGNQAIYGPAGTVKIDRSAPETLIDSNPANPSTSSNATFTFSGNDGLGSGISSFECQIDGGGFSTCILGTDFGPLSDGSHTFEVRSTDLIGNTDATPASYSWTIDATTPIVSGVDAVEKGTWEDFYPYIKGDEIFRLRADVLDLGMGLDTTSCEYTIDGTNWNPASFNSSTQRCIFDIASAVDGSVYTINFRIKDLAGNIGYGSPISYTVDSSRPTTTAISFNPDYSGYTNGSPVITGSLSDSVSPIVQCQYRYRTTGSGDAGWSAWVNGTWTTDCSASITGLSDGQSYDFSMRGQDSVGHFGGGMMLFETRIADATSPSVDAGIDRNANSQISQDATASDSLSGIASYAWTQESGPGTITFTSPSTEDTDVSADTDGTYILRLTVTDFAGNSAYDEFELVWDTTSPIIIYSEENPADGLLTNNNDQTFSVEFNEDVSNCSINFGLDNGGFERGDLSEWSTSGNANWYVDGSNRVEGSYSARSGNLWGWNNVSSTIQRTVTVGSSSTVSFWWKVSSEGSYDYLRFYVDGIHQNAISGWYDWNKMEYNLSPGTHTLRWSYTKDYSVTSGSDAGWIDDVRIAGGTGNSQEMTIDNDTHTALIDISDMSDGIYNYSVHCNDPASNLGTTETRSLTVDTTAPNLSSKTTFSGWYNTNQTSTFEYSDLNGIASGNNPTCEILTEGVGQTCSVTPNVCDNAGNCNTDEVTSNGADIDKTNPVVDAGGDKIKNAQFNQDATTSDSLSGITSYAWTQQSGPGTITFTSPSTEDTDVSADAEGTYVLRLTVTDNAGNSSFDEFELVWDTTAPETFFSIDPATPNGDNDWYDSKPIFTLTATDTYGVDYIEYQLNGTAGAWTTYTGPVTLEDGIWQVYFRSIDKASNVSSVGLKDVKVDTENPSNVDNLEVEYESDFDRNKLTWNVDDSDIHKVYIYRGDNKDFSVNTGSKIAENDRGDDDYSDYDIELGEKYYYKIVTLDEAGNRSNRRIISITLPIEEDGEAVVTDEGTEASDETDEGAVAGESSENNDSQENNEDESVLGEQDSYNQENQSWSWNWNWLWLLLALVGYLTYRKFRKIENA